MNTRKVWRNAYRFTEAPEIKHDGHAVEVLKVFRPEPGEPIVMATVHCLTDREGFDAFREELFDK